MELGSGEILLILIVALRSLTNASCPTSRAPSDTASAS